MHRSVSLIRIRFPHDLVDRLDRLAERLRLKDTRRIPRAAVVRALVQIHLGAADEDQDEALTNMLGADPVRRGRGKRPQGPRRRARPKASDSTARARHAPVA